MKQFNYVYSIPIDVLFLAIEFMLNLDFEPKVLLNGKKNKTFNFFFKFDL